MAFVVGGKFSAESGSGVSGRTKHTRTRPFTASLQGDVRKHFSVYSTPRRGSLAMLSGYRGVLVLSLSEGVHRRRPHRLALPAAAAKLQGRLRGRSERGNRNTPRRSPFRGGFGPRLPLIYISLYLSLSLYIYIYIYIHPSVASRRAVSVREVLGSRPPGPLVAPVGRTQL